MNSSVLSARMFDLMFFFVFFSIFLKFQCQCCCLMMRGLYLLCKHCGCHQHSDPLLPDILGHQKHSPASKRSISVVRMRGSVDDVCLRKVSTDRCEYKLSISSVLWCGCRYKYDSRFFYCILTTNRIRGIFCNTTGNLL